jgi:tetratricopeptide (TPR) repeat protein
MVGWLMAAALVLFLAGSAPARAGIWSDCVDETDPVLAIDACDAIIAEAGDDIGLAVAYYERGQAYLAKDQPDRAIADFDRAIALTPDFADAYHERGAAYLDTGQLVLAIASYDEAIRLDPANGYAYYTRGLTHYDTGNATKALADLRDAVRLIPESDPWHAEAVRSIEEIESGTLTNSSACFAETDMDELIDACTKIIAKGQPAERAHGQSLAKSYVNRGNGYRAKGDVSAAIADYNRAIELFPYLRSAYQARALAHLGERRFDQAIADFDKAVELDPDDRKAYRDRGLAKAAAGDKVGALADFRKAERLMAPGDPLRANVLALIAGLEHLLSQSSTKPTPETPAAAGPPASADDRSDCAQEADRERRVRGCTAIIDSGEGSMADRAGAFANRGWAYHEDGDYDRAIADYDRVLELTPDDVEIIRERGLAHLLAHHYEPAISDFSTSLAAEPDHAYASFLRGLAYERIGEFEKALADLQKAESRIDNESLHQDILKWIAKVEAELETIASGSVSGALVQLWNACSTVEQPDRAIAACTEIIADSAKHKLEPPRPGWDLASAHHKRGLAYLAKGYVDDALVDIDVTIKLAPDNAEAYVGRGILYYAKDELDRAIAAFDEAIRLVPDFAYAYLHRGFAYDDKGDTAKALEDLRMAARLVPRGDSIEKGALDRIADIKGRSRQALPKTGP